MNYSKLKIVNEKNDMYSKKIKLQAAYEELEIKEVLKKNSKKEELNFINDQIYNLDKKYLNAKYSNEIINDVYVTFYNTKHCEVLKKAFKISLFYRCLLHSICCQKRIKYLYFDNEWLEIKQQIDDPTNIRWENIQYSNCNRFIRRFCAIFVSILIIISSIAVVMAAKYGELQIDLNFNTSIDCKYVDKTLTSLKQEIRSDVSNKDRIVLNCFCLNYLIDKGVSGLKNFKIDLDSKIYNPCESWLDLWLKSQFLKILVIVIVPVINIFLSIFLELSTNFEKNKFSSDHMTSIMWKSFIIQFINTGIIIVLVNMEIKEVISWNETFPFFTGKYDDLNPSWYFDVGSTILFYMIINIFSPHIACLISYYYLLMRRCCDRKFSKNKNTAKLTRTEYFDLYIGPEFSIGSRYAQILSSIFVVLIYSSGMPILYICCFLFFLITFWVDKWMILRFYRTPPHTDLYISKLFNQIILLGIIVHFCVGLWIYGNKQIFYDGNSTSLNGFKDFLTNNLKINLNFSNYFVNTLKEKILLPHNLLYFLFLIIFFLIFLFQFFLKKFLGFIFCVNFCNLNCSKKNMLKKSKLFEVLPFESSYYNLQLKIAKFLKYKKSKNYYKISYIKKKYFDEGIEKDKNYILKNLEITNDKNNDFKNEVDKYLKGGNYKVKDTDIKGETSYNMATQYKFRHLIYFEYILPLKNK